SAQRQDTVNAFADWIENHSLVPWLKLDLPWPHEEMLREARALKELFVAHRHDVNPGWLSLCLHGVSPQHTEDYDRYGFASRAETPYRWTEIADACPVTARFFREVWPMEKFERVRFMLLNP